MTAAGLLLGLAGAWAATRPLESQLYGVARMDPMTIGAVALVMAGVALAAALVPARRAAGFEPVRALRVD